MLAGADGTQSVEGKEVRILRMACFCELPLLISQLLEVRWHSQPSMMLGPYL